MPQQVSRFPTIVIFVDILGFSTLNAIRKILVGDTKYLVLIHITKLVTLIDVKTKS